MNDLGSDFSKSYLIYIEECLGTFYSKHPSGPHLPLCPGKETQIIVGWRKVLDGKSVIIPQKPPKNPWRTKQACLPPR